MLMRGLAKCFIYMGFESLDQFNIQLAAMLCVQCRGSLNLIERQPHHRGAQVQWRNPARTLVQERHLRSQLWAGALESGARWRDAGEGPRGS